MCVLSGKEIVSGGGAEDTARMDNAPFDGESGEASPDGHISEVINMLSGAYNKLKGHVQIYSQSCSGSEHQNRSLRRSTRGHQ
jgi:hypothetical protein